MTNRTQRLPGKRYVHTAISSPVGRLTLVATDEGLAAILWANDRPGRVRLPLEAEEPTHPILIETGRQLAEYFAGARTSFTLPLDPHGTPFQQKVWRALLTIPFGETRTYSEIARQIGSAAAGRAVGAANGRNRIAIVVPCHRVIGADGSLTGFAAGLDRKRFLLGLEAKGRPREHLLF